MGFFDAEHLFAEVENIRAVGIRRSCSNVTAVVDGVDSGQGIFLRECLIESNGSEIFLDGL